MLRKIIHINQDVCSGCGLCTAACHEGAIQMIDKKAVLTREDYCDGLGDCLPACPEGAITFEEREAPAYDKTAVELAKRRNNFTTGGNGLSFGIDYAHNAAQSRRTDRYRSHGVADSHGTDRHPQAAQLKNQHACESFLSQWPIQIKLTPIHAPCFDNSDLLIAADCTSFAYGGFHQDFIRNHAVLIGCPKLDEVDYSKKLAEILTSNSIKSVTVVRMEVPCCGGIQYAVERAMEQSGKSIPLKVVTIGITGALLS